MAKIIVKSTALDDHGHYGTTTYTCSECGGSCDENTTDSCPHCKVVFDEASDFESSGYPFGGSDF